MSDRYSQAYSMGNTDRAPYPRSNKRARGKSSQAVDRTFQSRVNQVLMKKSETKYYDRGVEDVELFHNLGRGTLLLPPTVVTSIPQLFNVWADIAKGTDRFNRIGDVIIPRGIKLNMWIANKTDRENTKVRVIVAVLPKAYGGSVVPYDWNPLQQPNSGALGNTMLYPADKDKGVKFLYDKIHVIGAQQTNNTANKEKSQFLRLWIKPKRGSKITFDTTSSTIVNKPIAIYCVPYEQFNTATTSNIASCAAYMRLYYKDP